MYYNRGMVTVIDETGTRHEMDGIPAQIVATLVEGRRLLPAAGKYSVEFDCSDADVIMRPRLTFRRQRVTAAKQ